MVFKFVDWMFNLLTQSGSLVVGSGKLILPPTMYVQIGLGVIAARIMAVQRVSNTSDSIVKDFISYTGLIVSSHYPEDKLYCSLYVQTTE